jgi:hypothetical protein
LLQVMYSVDRAARDDGIAVGCRARNGGDERRR